MEFNERHALKQRVEELSSDDKETHYAHAVIATLPEPEVQLPTFSRFLDVLKDLETCRESCAAGMKVIFRNLRCIYQECFDLVS